MYVSVRVDTVHSSSFSQPTDFDPLTYEKPNRPPPVPPRPKKNTRRTIKAGKYVEVLVDGVWKLAVVHQSSPDGRYKAVVCETEANVVVDGTGVRSLEKQPAFPQLVELLAERKASGEYERAKVLKISLVNKEYMYLVMYVDDESRQFTPEKKLRPMEFRRLTLMLDELDSMLLDASQFEAIIPRARKGTMNRAAAAAPGKKPLPASPRAASPGPVVATPTSPSSPRRGAGAASAPKPLPVKQPRTVHHKPLPVPKQKPSADAASDATRSSTYDEHDTDSMPPLPAPDEGDGSDNENPFAEPAAAVPADNPIGEDDPFAVPIVDPFTESVEAPARKSKDAVPRVSADLGSSARDLQTIASAKGPDMDASGIFEAAARGDVETIVRLVNDGKVFVDYRRRTKDARRGCSALHYAAEHNQLAAAEVLLRMGADVDHRDAAEMTVLHKAVASKCNVELLELLLAASPNLMASTADGYNLLHLVETVPAALLVLKVGEIFLLLPHRLLAHTLAAVTVAQGTRRPPGRRPRVTTASRGHQHVRGTRALRAFH